MLVSQQVHSVRATDNRIYCENEKNTIKFLNAFNASSPRHTCNPPMHSGFYREETSNLEIEIRKWIVSLSNNNNDDITAQAVQYRNIPTVSKCRQTSSGWDQGEYGRMLILTITSDTSPPRWRGAPGCGTCTACPMTAPARPSVSRVPRTRTVSTPRPASRPAVRLTSR